MRGQGWGPTTTTFIKKTYFNKTVNQNASDNDADKSAWFFILRLLFFGFLWYLIENDHDSWFNKCLTQRWQWVIISVVSWFISLKSADGFPSLSPLSGESGHFQTFLFLTNKFRILTNWPLCQFIVTILGWRGVLTIFCPFK